MNEEFFFKSDVVAGIFMAKLATKFGIQSHMHTMTTSYRISAVISKDKTAIIKAYADGLQDGLKIGGEE